MNGTFNLDNYFYDNQDFLISTLDIILVSMKTKVQKFINSKKSPNYDKIVKIQREIESWQKSLSATIEVKKTVNVGYDDTKFEVEYVGKVPMFNNKTISSSETKVITETKPDFATRKNAKKNIDRLTESLSKFKDANNDIEIYNKYQKPFLDLKFTFEQLIKNLKDDNKKNDYNNKYLSIVKNKNIVINENKQFSSVKEKELEI